MSNISAISWEEQVTFEEIILMTAFALDQHTYFGFL
jgi:hypothetical protein